MAKNKLFIPAFCDKGSAPSSLMNDLFNEILLYSLFLTVKSNTVAVPHSFDLFPGNIFFILIQWIPDFSSAGFVSHKGNCMVFFAEIINE